MLQNCKNSSNRTNAFHAQRMRICIHCTANEDTHPGPAANRCWTSYAPSLRLAQRDLFGLVAASVRLCFLRSESTPGVLESPLIPEVEYGRSLPCLQAAALQRNAGWGQQTRCTVSCSQVMQTPLYSARLCPANSRDSLQGSKSTVTEPFNTSASTRLQV